MSRTAMTKFRLLLIVAFSIFASAEAVPAQDSTMGMVSGQLIVKDQGVLAQMPVFIYNASTGPAPSPDRYWRSPTLVVITDEDGKFNARIKEGNYYLGAMLNRREGMSGPPRGDTFVFLVRDSGGRAATTRIRGGENLDLGRIELQPPHEESHAASRDIAAIEGVVRDAAGKPLPGAIVFASLDMSMGGEVLFVSDTTGEDGRYLLRVPGGGNYYLQVRDGFSGRTYNFARGTASASSNVFVGKSDIVRGLDLQIDGFRHAFD